MVDKNNWKPVPWSIKEENDEVEFSTVKFKVKIIRENGSVSFFDLAGNKILQENLMAENYNCC